jgi:hypothetical protein
MVTESDSDNDITTEADEFFSSLWFVWTTFVCFVQNTLFLVVNKLFCMIFYNKKCPNKQ